MTQEEAKKWAKNKANQAQFLKKFFVDYPPHQKHLAFFMAGIPGAGKTEFAENTINRVRPKLVPIEHDKLVEYIPGYKPEGYYNYRKAGSVLVSCLLEECIKRGYGFIFDGTLSHEQGYRNIQKSLDAKYFVQVIYIVQNARKAWELTRDRELVKKRAIKMKGFVDTCNKMNTNLSSIFNKFKHHKDFGFWIINKNGQVGISAAKTIIYSQGIGSHDEVEKVLSEQYNIDEIGFNNDIIFN